MWVGTGIVASPLFKIEIPSMSECIRFGSEFARAEANDKVELG